MLFSQVILMEQLNKIIAIQEFDFYSNLSKEKLIRMYRVVCPEDDLTIVRRIFRRKLEKEIKKKCEDQDSIFIDFVYEQIKDLLTDEIDELLIKILMIDILNNINFNENEK